MSKIPIFDQIIQKINYRATCNWEQNPKRLDVSKMVGFCLN